MCKYYVTWWKPVLMVFSVIASIFFNQYPLFAPFSLVGQAMKYILFIFIKMILLIVGTMLVLDLFFKTRFVKAALRVYTVVALDLHDEIGFTKQTLAELFKEFNPIFKEFKCALTDLKPLTVVCISFALFWFAGNIFALILLVLYTLDTVLGIILTPFLRLVFEFILVICVTIVLRGDADWFFAWLKKQLDELLNNDPCREESAAGFLLLFMIQRYQNRTVSEN